MIIKKHFHEDNIVCLLNSLNIKLNEQTVSLFDNIDDRKKKKRKKSNALG